MSVTKTCVIGAAEGASRGRMHSVKPAEGMLTTKEVEIMRLVADGHANKEIACRRAISDNTVETHLRRVNQKLKTRRRTEAVAKLRRLGVLG